MVKLTKSLCLQNEGDKTTPPAAEDQPVVEQFTAGDVGSPSVECDVALACVQAPSTERKLQHFND